ncbi:hypothetical protein D3C87_1865800 [compost metagenome]
MSVGVGRVLVGVDIQDGPAIAFFGNAFFVQLLQISADRFFGNLEILGQISDMDFFVAVQFIDNEFTAFERSH